MRSSTSRWPPNVTKCYSPVLHREVLQRGDLFRHQDGTSQIWNFYEEYSICLLIIVIICMHIFLTLSSWWSFRWNSLFYKWNTIKLVMLFFVKDLFLKDLSISTFILLRGWVLYSPFQTLSNIACMSGEKWDGAVLLNGPTNWTKFKYKLPWCTSKHLASCGKQRAAPIYFYCRGGNTKFQPSIFYYESFLMSTLNQMSFQH